LRKLFLLKRQYKIIKDCDAKLVSVKSTLYEARDACGILWLPKEYQNSTVLSDLLVCLKTDTINSWEELVSRYELMLYKDSLKKSDVAEMVRNRTRTGAEVREKAENPLNTW
jgi:hypothetical protein